MFVEIMFAFCDFCHICIEHAEPQELLAEEHLAAQAAGRGVREDAL